MKFCPNCGTPITQNSKFCTECGFRLMAPVQETTPPAPVAPPVRENAPFTAPVEAPVVPPVRENAPFTPPVQPYAPAQQPFAPAQQPYAPAQQPFAPAQQPFAPAQQPVDTRPPYTAQPTQPVKPAKKNALPLIFGIVGVVALIVIAIFVVLKFFGGNDAVLGRYHLESMSLMGIQMSAEDVGGSDVAWIELEKNSFTMYMDGEQVEGTWSLDGENLSLTAEGETISTTLKDDVLTMLITQEGMEMTIVFRKDGAAKTTTPVVAATETQITEVGYWTLLRMENDAEPAMAIDEESARTMRETGMEIFVVLNADGTGEGCILDDTAIVWKDGELDMTTLELSMYYELKDGQLLVRLFEGSNMVYVFVPGTGEAPELGLAGKAPVVTAVDYSWWEGDWYGWWIISDAEGEFAALEDVRWDAMASIVVNSDDTGTILLWDEDTTMAEPLGTLNIEFEKSGGEHGTFYTTSGEFCGAEVGLFDWIVDSESYLTVEFEDMICINGSLNVSTGESMEYYIFLRPWGMEWDDVEEATNDISIYSAVSPYSNMMPDGYESFYLPLLEKGVTQAPSSYEGS